MATPEIDSPDGNNGDKPNGADNVAVTIPPEKRGRGRPRGSTNKRPAGEVKTENRRAPDEIVAMLDPALVGDLFVSLSEIGDDMFVMLIMSRATAKLSGQYLEGFKGELARIRLGEKDKRVIREAGIALAKKYPFLQRWGPEIVLLIAGVQYSARMGNCLRNINALPDKTFIRTSKPEETPARS